MSRETLNIGETLEREVIMAVSIRIDNNMRSTLLNSLVAISWHSLVEHRNCLWLVKPGVRILISYILGGRSEAIQYGGRHLAEILQRICRS